jgi:hypothetical protein
LFFIMYSGSSWSWSYGSWIYNYLCKKCLSPLTLWVRIALMARCDWYKIMWYNLTVNCDRSVVFSGYSGFLQTDCHDIAVILLKVALNTITPIIHSPWVRNSCRHLTRLHRNDQWNAGSYVSVYMATLTLGLGIEA